ncbi:hypothetical protein ES705_15227 [subsurface metagenome]
MPKWIIYTIRIGWIIIAILLVIYLILVWVGIKEDRVIHYIEKHIPIIIEKEIPVYIESNLRWEIYEVTSYTQNDPGCDNITSIGIDLDGPWVEYFNIVAVDPELIPYGSVVIIKMPDGEIVPAIAGDCGGAIKGKRIDLYVESLDEAFQFGRQNLRVAVIEK